MKLLIVNADDLGVDEDRNEGILEGVRAGVVTSVSILVNGPAFGHAVELLTREKKEKRDTRSEGQGPSLGLHVNLTQGSPVSPGLRLLLGGDGRFRGRDGAFALLGEGEAIADGVIEEVRAEVARQLGRFLAAGLHPDHLDGHHHVHVLPAVAPVVADLARRCGIPWVRVPDEVLPPPWDPAVDERTLAEAGRFAGLAARARPVLEAAARVAAFRGLTFKGCGGPALSRLVEGLPEGVTELMTHPGRAASEPSRVAASGFGFSGAGRRAELEGLLAPAFRHALEACGVTLGGFPCGS